MNQLLGFEFFNVDVCRMWLVVEMFIMFVNVLVVLEMFIIIFVYLGVMLRWFIVNLVCESVYEFNVIEEQIIVFVVDCSMGIIMSVVVVVVNLVVLSSL